MKQKSPTNLLTSQILDYLFRQGVFCWRNSVGGGPLSYTTKSGEVKTRYMQMGKPGSGDILGCLPPTGTFLSIEIKTGKDKMRLEQEGFKNQLTKSGGIYLMVKTFPDFLEQYLSTVDKIKLT